ATGGSWGTPPPRAPDRAGRHPPDPRGGVYAVGAILTEMLTARPPFRAATYYDTLSQVMRDEPVQPRQLNAKLPPDLETICVKCLSKEAGNRYASAREMADDLRRWLAGEAIVARPAGRLEPAWRWWRRRPAVAGLLAAVAAVLIAATMISAGLAAWALGEARRAEENEREATRQRDKAEWLVYVGKLRLAQAAWRENNAPEAYQHLED